MSYYVLARCTTYVIATYLVFAIQYVATYCFSQSVYSTGTTGEAAISYQDEQYTCLVKTYCAYIQLCMHIIISITHLVVINSGKKLYWKRNCSQSSEFLNISLAVQELGMEVMSVESISYVPVYAYRYVCILCVRRLVPFTGKTKEFTAYIVKCKEIKEVLFSECIHSGVYWVQKIINLCQEYLWEIV